MIALLELYELPPQIKGNDHKDFMKFRLNCESVVFVGAANLKFGTVEIEAVIRLVAIKMRLVDGDLIITKFLNEFLLHSPLQTPRIL